MTRILAVALATLMGVVTASAQNYPTRPITLIVPYAPGGLSDAVARVVIEAMREPLGQPVVIENIGGASGTIGTGKVARAAPDGYTIALGIWNTHVSAPVIFKLDYDVVEDFAPIALIGDAPLVFCVKKDHKISNLKEFVDWLKANPDKATTGSAGTGSPGYLLHTLIKQQTGAQYEIVGYKGAGLIPHDLLSGQIDMAFINTSTALPHVRAGNLKALAVTSDSRLKIAPDIPTMAEAGFPGLQFSLWAGLFAPKGTPKEAIDKLNKAVVAALADPDVQKRLANGGVNLAPRDKQTPNGLAATQREEIKKWWPIIKAAGVKVN